MDFLDPRTRASRRRRLIISYLLMTLLVIGSAFVLLYSSFGYGINTKTGQIVQNGLVFIDSKPVAADIYINGKKTSQQTSARLVLAAGKYALSLQQPGYRPWSTSLSVTPQDVWRFKYPLLIPTNLKQRKVTVEKSAAFVSQTSDHRWIYLAQNSGLDLATIQIDANNPTASLRTARAKGVAGFAGGNWLALKWSGDNSRLLLQHSNGKQSEYVVLDRNNPTASYNLSKQSKLAISAASFKNSSQLYLLSGGKLYTYDLSSGSKLVLSSASNYAAIDDNRIIYLTGPATKLDKMAVMVWDGTKSYELAAVPASSATKLAAASSHGIDYYAISSNGLVQLYKAPIDAIKKGGLKPAYQLKMAATNIDFAPDGHAFMASSAQLTQVIDLDNSKQYNPKLPGTSPTFWLDNFHLSARTSKGQAELSDFDGTNHQILVPSSAAAGCYLSADARTIFTTSQSGSTTTLSSASLLVPKA